MPNAVQSVKYKLQLLLQETLNPKWNAWVAKGICLFDTLLSTAILFKVNCILISGFELNKQIQRLTGLHTWNKWSNFLRGNEIIL